MLRARMALFPGGERARPSKREHCRVARHVGRHYRVSSAVGGEGGAGGWDKVEQQLVD